MTNETAIIQWDKMAGWLSMRTASTQVESVQRQETHEIQNKPTVLEFLELMTYNLCFSEVPK